MKARRGDLSGPVLAILVTLVLLAIGAVLVAYFTLFTGQAPSPVLAVKDQPVAYRVGTNDMRVEVVVANVGSTSVTLHSGETRLRIVSPFSLERPLVTTTTIAPGESKTLAFMFSGEWGTFASHRSAVAVLMVKDTAGNTIGQFEVRIRIVGGG